MATPSVPTGPPPTSPVQRESPRRERNDDPRSRLEKAQTELQGALDNRLQKEIDDLTIRYSGDAVQAERVARARAERGFAGSDPTFETETLAPLRQKIAEIEDQIRRAGRQVGTAVGINGTETLG